MNVEGKNLWKYTEIRPDKKSLARVRKTHPLAGKELVPQTEIPPPLKILHLNKILKSLL